MPLVDKTDLAVVEKFIAAQRYMIIGLKAMVPDRADILHDLLKTTEDIANILELDIESEAEIWKMGAEICELERLLLL